MRVDGAADEGPSHHEVQFFWTARHLEKGYYATVVTSRSAGQSFLNRVELQNGCLSLAHSNLFIPSTLNGSNLGPPGKLDREKHNTMQLAMDVYISRVSDCPCGTGTIKLLKGADSTKHQQLRKDLLVYLKGTKKDLKRNREESFKYFEKVWRVRSSHMLLNFPINTALCWLHGCPHPVCASGNNPNHVWYDGGPSVTYIPLQVPDLTKPWGNTECDQCLKAGLSHCHGHFLKPEKALMSETPAMCEPPSVCLKREFKRNCGKRIN